MKAILEYNLPDDEEAFTYACDGWRWAHSMWELDQYLRTKTKYAPDTMPEEVYKALSETRDELHRILNENKLNLE